MPTYPLCKGQLFQVCKTFRLSSYPCISRYQEVTGVHQPHVEIANQAEAWPPTTKVLNNYQCRNMEYSLTCIVSSQTILWSTMVTWSAVHSISHNILLHFNMVTLWSALQNYIPLHMQWPAPINVITLCYPIYPTHCTYAIMCPNAMWSYMLKSILC